MYVQHSPLLELANYIALGRLLAYIPYCSPLPPKRMLRIFGILTLLVEALSNIGIPWICTYDEPGYLQNAGKALVITSLLLQIPIVSASLALAIIFQRRCRMQDSPEHAARVKAPLLTLYISTALILVRCIYRTVEYLCITERSLGGALAIERYEAFFYLFEATLMLANELLWNITFPMHKFPTSKLVYLARDGLTEAGPGKPKDGQSSSTTVMDRMGSP